MEMNNVLEKLPKHLLDLVIDQPYNDYTAQDHAVWRFVMRQNVRYLKGVAHHSYIEGLRQAGISIESIPHMYGMNRILEKIGWSAVAVDGFIPPDAFMEFQAYNVLVIAADIRPVNQIEYTPAPDIIHEAAGHAPIIADPDYAEYLRLFGEIGSKAFSSAHNYKVYEAVRHLSILKADPYTDNSEIKEAEFLLEELLTNDDPDSEMTQIRNLHWWTVEYGLIGDLDKPKIYGAGLLSSIGESYSSLLPEVKKLPYTIEAARKSFDITTRQPQLYVTPDFDHLVHVLNQFADGMALRRGGLYGLNLAIKSENYATCVYNSGLQISGVFTEVIDYNGQPAYIRTQGPTALSYNNKQLNGHGKNYHSQGFGSPVGRLKKTAGLFHQLKKTELAELGIAVGKSVHLEYFSGVDVNGIVDTLWFKEGKLLLISFTDCTVSFKDIVLFEPSWGTYDMAVGEDIVSAFSGIADPNAFEYSCVPPVEKTHKIIHSAEAKNLHRLYQKVRDIRENNKGFEELNAILKLLKSTFPNDWLLVMEIYELAFNTKMNELIEVSQQYLFQLKNNNADLAMMIDNGFQAVEQGIGKITTS